MKFSTRLPGVFFLLFLPTISCGQEAGPDPRNILEQFDVARDGDVLILPVDFQGKKYRFVLDTGASLTVYDRCFEAQLGQSTSAAQVKGPKGSKTVKLFRSPKAYLGKTGLQTSSPTFTLDLIKLREVSGEPIFGIIGMDFLAQKVIHIDFDKGKFYILRKRESLPGKRFKISYKRGIPHIRGDVPGHGPEDFSLDLGKIGGSGDLKGSILENLKKQKKARLAGHSLSETVSGTHAHSIFHVETFSLGEFTLANLLFDQAEMSILGTGLLSRFNVTLDFSNHEMYLAKNKQFHKTDTMDMSGLHILRSKGKTIVHSVDPDSPAALQGIKAKDVIVQIGAVDTGKTRLFVLRKLLSSEGKAIPIMLLRGDEERVIPLELKNWRKPIKSK
jgi:hypothetical protein